eukprot:scaffold566364_cov34-Prasinocladus_malaysianus.AAC.1
MHEKIRIAELAQVLRRGRMGRTQREALNGSEDSKALSNTGWLVVQLEAHRDTIAGIHTFAQYIH